jgi:hypothetical protein
LVLAATGANLALLSTVSYQAVDYMESEAFCGTVCHVMEPQFVAYQDSPHARVGCVECHVGPGAASFLGAKLEGAGRLSAMVFGHDLPVRLADGNRVQLAATCTNCHAAEPDPESVSLRMIRSHANDEASTPRTTLLTIHASDIHSIHVGTDIRYIAGNADRSAIPWTAGGSRVFTAGETTAGDPEPMTCIDCHNRSGHEFESAGQAIDRAINEGRLARTLPFARRDAVAALTDDTAFPAGAAAIDAALERNVFPDQGVDWNTYPSHRGHADDLGCFRCHDGMHVDPSGETVSRNCLSCHAMVAVGQEEPAILRQLGVRP